MKKTTLRKEILQKRNLLKPEERQEKSKKIVTYIIDSEEFRTADKILLFASYKSEVDTTDILRHALATSKQVYLPKVQKDRMEFYQVFTEDELQIGYHGIREPEERAKYKFPPLQQLQKGRILMLIPGAVFDTDGNRIGYGGGFYDKYLAKLEAQILEAPNVQLQKWAMAFECQVVEIGIIQAEWHDIKVDCVITEKYCR